MPEAVATGGKEMTEREWLKWLVEQPINKGESKIAAMKPGPIAMRLGPADTLAAKLLLWAEDELLPPDATLGDLLDVLDCARFWTFFWAALEPKVNHANPKA